jgi:hypothetical protein
MQDGLHARTACEKYFLSRQEQSPHDRSADAQQRDTCHTFESSPTHCEHRRCEKNNSMVRDANEK